LEVLEEEAVRGSGQMSRWRADLGGVGVIAGEWRIFFWEELGCEGQAVEDIAVVGGNSGELT
jgi:hypothetical protein